MSNGRRRGDFGGRRERVLERDGHLCRVCAELFEVDRLCVGQPPSVYHRVPGIWKLHLMITLCAAHHAQVERLQVAAKPTPQLLLVLWREQHPQGLEQTMLQFDTRSSCPEPVALFTGEDVTQSS